MIENITQNKIIADKKLSGFALDVYSGLKSKPKKLPSRCFYNDCGSELFKRIMQLPEYYLTQAEYHTLDENKNEIIKFIDFKDEFNLVEFGAGDGLKTKILLRKLIGENLKFAYYPVDISKDALRNLVNSLKSGFPTLIVKGLNKDYFEALNYLNEEASGNKNLILFLGSNIGNFEQEESIEFLLKLRNALNQGDLCLIGFDMVKNPFKIKKAYDDSKGITRAFNLNLLQRINDELGGDFDLHEFEHYPEYCPLTGAARSYIVSLKKQLVYIEKLDSNFAFEEGEAIHTEISQKYTPDMILNLALASGFNIKSNYIDSNADYRLSLWEAV